MDLLRWKSAAAVWVALILLPFMGACRASRPGPEPAARALLLATTTSTYDSGLLDAILPDFEAKYGVHVEVVAVGTGQALALGRAGDADVLLVHAPALEQEFVAGGYGTERYPVMYNDFIIVGPESDPAAIRTAASGAEAFVKIRAAGALFASRGDNSGTWVREMALWDAAGISVNDSLPWYNSLGQGMGASLQFAEEKDAYILTDRGTYLALLPKLPHLLILFGGATPAENTDPALRNFYSVIPVNPERFEGVDYELGMNFVRWLRSDEVQAMIGGFGNELYGIPLFFPDAGGSGATSGG